MDERSWPGAWLITSLCRWLAVAFVGTVWFACSPRSAERKPNVVVVLIDTLRPDYLEVYGYPRSTAPFLSSLAKDSVVFEHAFSTSSWTVPSVASMFTSTYPHRHGVVQGLMAFKKQLRKLEKKERASLTLNRLPDGILTLPEHFKHYGYSTFGIAANVNLGPDLGFQRGFDRFFHQPRLGVRDVHRLLD